MTYKAKEHTVDARRIVNVTPLVLGGRMLGPDEGTTLVLDDATKHRFVGNGRESMPQEGDWLVKSDALNITFVVPAAKFFELFAEIAATK